MQNLHRTTDNTFLAPDTRRVGQGHRFTTQSPALDVDSHLAVLIADIAIDALSFFRGDFKLRPAAPEIHPERQRAPHAAPVSYTHLTLPTIYSV